MKVNVGTREPSLLNKGFTLIELLAVIVILAIIAIIAVPIVLNLIADSKKEAARVNVENYFDAIEISMTKYYMQNKEENLDGTYEIIENGKKLKSKATEKEYQIGYDGKSPVEGTLLVQDGKVKKVSGLKIEKWHVKLTKAKIELVAEMKISKLISSSSFDDKIKTIVDLKEIKSIEFLSNGMLPSGYTLESMKQLKNVDLSLDKNESIVAYYDSGSIYVYSENLISFQSSIRQMFTPFTSLEYVNFGSIDTNDVTDMSLVFYNCFSLKEAYLGEFDTSNVESMYAMFYNCSNLEKIDISNFDITKVENMSGMFSGCKNLKELDLSSFTKSKVNSFQSLFNGLSSLEKIDISNLDTSDITNMSGMFSGCENLKELDISNFNTSNVTTMANMFNGCTNLKKINLGNINTKKVENMYMMFSGTGFETLDLSKLDTDSVTNMSYMFSGSLLKSIDLSDFNTTKLEDMSLMFYKCSNIEKINLSSFNIKNTQNMYGAFSGCNKLKSVIVNENLWVINENTNIDAMFFNSSIKEVTYK